MTRLKLVVGVVVAAVLVGCSAQPEEPVRPPAALEPEAAAEEEPQTEPETFDVVTQIAVGGGMIAVDKATEFCAVGGPERAIFNKDDSQIQLLDATGAIVAISTLGETFVEDEEQKICTRTAVFEDVPAGGNFYRVTIDNRVSDAYPEAELASGAIALLVIDSRG